MPLGAERRRRQGGGSRARAWRHAARAGRASRVEVHAFCIDFYTIGREERRQEGGWGAVRRQEARGRRAWRPCGGRRADEVPLAAGVP